MQVDDKSSWPIREIYTANSSRHSRRPLTPTMPAPISVRPALHSQIGECRQQASSILGQSMSSVFPARRLSGMVEPLKNTHALLGEGSADDYCELIAPTHTFCWFWNPFLDGNGHVQRAIFAAMATNFGYAPSPRFVIHARPFDRLPGNPEGQLLHVYPPADDPILCLFGPREDEWAATMTIATTTEHGFIHEGWSTTSGIGR
ncbi:hypothetical protein [Bradyrhizobium iriomotense]|uniref:hypothetical protein n=1 Tax=Bradyrhizobium iriomotense TaxID=441950 RepID=UPI0024E0B7D9|nr:hypothetical protein [Bradyrhizobium iriomotense]